jgi:hypothetical protein
MERINTIFGGYPSFSIQMILYLHNQQGTGKDEDDTPNRYQPLQSNFDCNI